MNVILPNILIVDDNAAALKLYQKIFQSSGLQQEVITYHIEKAQSGERALEKVQKLYEEGKTLDLALLDIHMPPGINGIETAKRLKIIDPTIIIVLASAYSEFTLEEITTQMGGPDDLLVIQKPFQEKEIKQLVHLLTTRSQERRGHLSFFRKLVQPSLSLIQNSMNNQETNQGVLKLLDLVNDVTGSKESGISAIYPDGQESVLIGLSSIQEKRRQASIQNLKEESNFFPIHPCPTAQENYKLILQGSKQSEFLAQGIAHELIPIIPQLQQLLKQQLEHKQHRKEAPLDSFHGILTSDEVMKGLFKRIQRVAGCGAPIFITGETGTGKELVAKALHSAGERAKEKLISINCANFTNELLESQLFGHRKGSFTGATQDQKGLFAAAEKGTLFLDEITEIPIQLQAKLLRVLQEKEFTPVGDTKAYPFDVQLISASQFSLTDAVSKGTFRQDLQYRLQVIPLSLPALRERGHDPLQLAHHFLEEGFKNKRPEDTTPTFSEEVLILLEKYNWPGNIRELLNLIQYIVIMQENNTIQLSDLPEEFATVVAKTYGEQQRNILESQLNPTKTTTSVEITKNNVLQILENHQGNKSEAAKELGMSRMTLWRKMKQWNL